MHSLEGKNNLAGIRWDKDTATVSWGKGFVLPVMYDHITQTCTKKPLSKRWHNLGGLSEMVQRDCYSAFLAKNVTSNNHNPSLLEQSWAAAEPLL